MQNEFHGKSAQNAASSDDLIENQIFERNIAEGLGKMLSSQVNEPAFIIQVNSGQMKVWNPTFSTHAKVMEKEKWNAWDCLIGFAETEGARIKTIEFYSPHLPAGRAYDLRSARARVISMLRAFTKAGLPDDTEVNIIKDAYGNRPGVRTEEARKIFPALSSTESRVTGRLSDYLAQPLD